MNMIFAAVAENKLVKRQAGTRC